MSPTDAIEVVPGPNECVRTASVHGPRLTPEHISVNVNDKGWGAGRPAHFHQMSHLGTRRARNRASERPVPVTALRH
jgi:hypothetical protein